METKTFLSQNDHLQSARAQLVQLSDDMWEITDLDLGGNTPLSLISSRLVRDIVTWAEAVKVNLIIEIDNFDGQLVKLLDGYDFALWGEDTTKLMWTYISPDMRFYQMMDLY